MVLGQMVGEILRNSILVIDVPIETIFETNTIDLYVQLESTNATRRLLFWDAVAVNRLTNGVSNLALKMD